jgi:ATP-dependent DNA helicase RecG
MHTERLSLERDADLSLAFVPRPDPELIAATAVALANTDGGRIVLGLDQAGEAGAAPDAARFAAAVEAAAARCLPPIAFGAPEIVPTSRGPALAVHVPRSRQVHALDDGRVLARTLAGNTVLNGEEIRGLLQARTNGDFETEVVPGARPADLDPALLADLMKARARRTGRPVTDPALETIGAFTPDYRVTVAGLLLFGREPERWLPQAGARLVRHIGRGPQAPVAFERTFGGALVRLLDQVWAALREQMRTPAAAPESLPYPPDAVRELLSNAVCHRDYRLRHEQVTVHLYDDSLEIVSPGGLPAFLSTRTLLAARYRRNPCLTNILAEWGYVRGTGGGVWRVLRAMDGCGAPPPEFVAGPYSVTVRLYAPCETPQPAPSPEANLNERQRSALAYVQRHGSITLRELRAMWPLVRPDLLQHDLSGLVSEGYLRRVSGRAGVYYALPW